MNPYQWPPVGHDSSNDFQHLGWCYFVPPASVVQAAAPSTHNLPIATPEVQPAPQITPENSQAIALASRGESQVRQDTWSLAERRLNPPTRRVRFVEANSRLPVAEDNVPGQMDLTGASVHPADNFESPHMEDRTSTLEQFEFEFSDLETPLVASVLIDAPNIERARSTLRRIREETSNVRIAREKQNSRDRAENLQMNQENEYLRQRLIRSQAEIQNLLEREFPRLSIQVVAITLYDHDYDVQSTREVLRSLSNY
ncbi:hypothetical protein G7Y79_00002g007660 [Physcia stellaris]|nr:hypothetical protein G7Y79_00002g007660 [Physcia stellaris]